MFRCSVFVKSKKVRRRELERDREIEMDTERERNREKGRTGEGGREKRKEMSRVMMPGIRAVNMGEIGENHYRQ